MRQENWQIQSVRWLENWRLSWFGAPHHSWFDDTVLKIYQVGIKTSHFRSERRSWFLIICEALIFWNWWRWFSMMYSYQRGRLGTLLSSQRQADEQGVATFFLYKIKKFHTIWSAGKFMLMFFWDCEDPIMEHYMHWGIIANSEVFCDLLLSNTKTFSQVNTSQFFTFLMASQSWCNSSTNCSYAFECLPRPACSPDLTLYDCHLFVP